MSTVTGLSGLRPVLDGLCFKIRMEFEFGLEFLQDGERMVYTFISEAHFILLIINYKILMALRTLKGIKELRFLLCQTSSASDGLRYLHIPCRAYIANNYEAIRESPASITIR